MVASARLGSHRRAHTPPPPRSAVLRSPRSACTRSGTPSGCCTARSNPQGPATSPRSSVPPPDRCPSNSSGEIEVVSNSDATPDALLGLMQPQGGAAAAPQWAPGSHGDEPQALFRRLLVTPYDEVTGLPYVAQPSPLQSPPQPPQQPPQQPPPRIVIITATRPSPGSCAAWAPAAPGAATPPAADPASHSGEDPYQHQQGQFQQSETWCLPPAPPSPPADPQDASCAPPWLPPGASTGWSCQPYSSPPIAPVPEGPAPPQQLRVVSVRFKSGAQSEYSCLCPAVVGDHVIVTADRGTDLGEVVGVGQVWPQAADSLPRALRVATADEVGLWHDMIPEESEAKEECQRIVDRYGIPITIVHAEFQFDKRKLTFLYTSREVDPRFRRALNDCYAVWKCRIWFSRCALQSQSGGGAAAGQDQLQYWGPRVPPTCDDIAYEN
eukprot:TRINITY_DN18403_c0_g1_i1.p1 TRINITY_DN18403_c0_g1~~TRINITY_DN18403_c0_g1_i1.p1  ORF type:complete len:477 (+),score=93.94 TRINITY_DN18403_c0_g1_i1:116-1432(+)